MWGRFEKRTWLFGDRDAVDAAAPRDCEYTISRCVKAFNAKRHITHIDLSEVHPRPDTA